ncbi:amidase [Trematosphaeria pertusa]|uniref:Amidase n=1 Tax=Trematosphaeria pertusa TaxID=390896 RepID=A0A6A6HRL0_9PLEO|nr:amidase [Trematosphaeria pertusa]KAF2240746.1 amidase [Trematosphaeria pertusa]
MSSTRPPQSATSIDDDVEITVGDVRYLLIPNSEVNFLHGASFGGDAVALVLVYVVAAGHKISMSALRDFRANILERDDVFRPDFYHNLVFYGSKKEDVHIDPDALDELAVWNVKTQTFVAGNPGAKVAPGPYAFLRGKTWQPWRIYYDFNACFMTSFKPSPRAGIDGRVVVPSRCYFKPSKLRPLDGARISVKDSIDIAGHKTTLCNRSWIELYPPKAEHAACIQVLLDAGAVIVGKVKLQAMIMREEPLECVEFTAPFNPRADGYQNPSGSSHASAAGIGSYDWLDFSVGSDTNGSGRKPASYNGCFSIRPSTGIMDRQGVVGYFPQFDMPVFYGRDISRFSEFISVWYGDSPTLRAPSEMPVEILYPSDYLPTSNAAQTRLIDKLVSGMESALQVKRTHISLAELWKRDCPDGTEHRNIADYLDTAGIYPFYHDQYHNLAPFREEYAKKYGKPPFVHRALHWQWDVGKSISQEERDECWRRSEVYRHWLLGKVFKADSKDSITIMVLPIEAGEPNYRDAELPPYGLLSGYAALNMSPMMRAPEVTAPVGDIPYNSIVTQREELPIAASVIGAPGMDLILVDLVEKGMNAVGVPTKVKTGRSMY